MSEVDFFEEQGEESGAEGVKNRITNYVSEWRKRARQVAEFEDLIKQEKIRIGELEMRLIPDALLEAGMSKITTVDGLEVSTQLYVGAIPAESKQAAFAWMDNNGHGSIIKRSVSVQFDKGSTEAARKAEEAIRQLGLEPKTALDVHYQTFKAFVKEQANKGKILPLDSWGVFSGNKAVIKGG